MYPFLEKNGILWGASFLNLWLLAARNWKVNSFCNQVTLTILFTLSNYIHFCPWRIYFLELFHIFGLVLLWGVAKKVILILFLKILYFQCPRRRKKLFLPESVKNVTKICSVWLVLAKIWKVKQSRWLGKDLLYWYMASEFARYGAN